MPPTSFNPFARKDGEWGTARGSEQRRRVYWRGPDEFLFVEQVQAISFVQICTLCRRITSTVANAHVENRDEDEMRGADGFLETSRVLALCSSKYIVMSFAWDVYVSGGMKKRWLTRCLLKTYGEGRVRNTEADDSPNVSRRNIEFPGAPRIER